MQVKDVMTTGIACVESKSSVSDVLVVDGNQVAGMVAGVLAAIPEELDSGH